MTGFANASQDTPAGALTLELRCVNNRFLDLSLRIPDELRAAEPALREVLSGAVARGKLECRIGVQRRPPDGRQPALDLGLLAGLAATARAVREVAPDAAPLSVADLMRWPGVVLEPALDPDTLPAAAAKLAREALKEFRASREREGAKLAALIIERADRMEAIVDKLAGEVPALLSAFTEKLTERLRGALFDATTGAAVPADETMARIRQEVTLYGMRIDVDEELGRLRTHIAEVRRVIAHGGAVGKRLDFLLQELNREANTLGSKAANTGLADAAIDLKLLIEQIREQVQNLE